MILHEYHDAEFIGVRLLAENSAELTFILSGGLTKLLILQGADMRIVDFTSQNVVSRMKIVSGDDAVISEVESDVRWLASRSDFAWEDTGGRLQTLVQSILAGDVILVSLEPSAGAEMVAICKSYRESVPE